MGKIKFAATVAAAATGTPEATIIIDQRRNVLSAPEAIMFDIDLGEGWDVANPSDPLVYNPSYHLLDYYWTFSTAGTHTTSNRLPTSWNDKNIATGRNVSHAFMSAGDYLVTCVITQPETTTRSFKQLTVTRTVTVGNPETVFAGNKTICVGSSFTGAPAGSQQVATPAEAFTALRNLGASTPARILFKCGESFGFGTVLNHLDPSVQVGSFGSGAKPIINDINVDLYVPGSEPPTYNGKIYALFDLSSAFDGDSTKDFVLYDLDCRGQWDPTTETGVVAALVDSNAGANHQIINCDSAGFSHTLVGDDQSFPTGFNTGATKPVTTGYYVMGSHITDWEYFGIFTGVSPTSRVGVVGCSIRQNPMALEGGHKFQDFEGKWHNTHGPIRISSARKSHVAANDLATSGGWDRFDNGEDDDSPTLQIYGVIRQPCLRLRTHKREDGQYANVERNVMEGGFRPIEIEEFNPAEGRNACGNVMIDRNLLIGDHTSVGLIKTDMNGVTVRNNKAYMPKVPFWKSRWLSFVDFSDYTSKPVSANFATGDNHVYNNSFCNFLTASESNGQGNIDADYITTGSYFAATKINANIVWYPARTDHVSSGSSANVPFDSTEMFSAYTMPGRVYRGNNDEADGPITVDAQYIIPAGSSPSLRPQTGNPAIASAAGNDATGLYTAYRDFDLIVRPSSPSKGAQEPA